MALDEPLSQDDIDKLEINETESVLKDIENIVILIRNELNMLVKQAIILNEKNRNKVKKKLNSILDEVIDTRKIKF